MKYSFVIPVFNRPDEVDELLESLTKQSLQDFEVLIVEDGSSQPCQEVAERYADALNVVTVSMRHPIIATTGSSFPHPNG